MKNLSEKARELRNAYQREYLRRHPEKRQEYNIKYWERKAELYTPEVQARELQALGFTQREIAQRLKLSLGTVNTILNKK